MIIMDGTSNTVVKAAIVASEGDNVYVHWWSNSECNNYTTKHGQS